MIILENRIKFTKSYELYERSCKSYWHGTTQSKTPENYIPGQFPLFIEKSKGAYLWDIDGNRYTDYIMGYGAISLGYCIDEVDEAAIAQIRNGFMTSLTSPVQTQLAELLVDVIPCAERVHLCKTGSDATAAAVRLARIHTGRDKIVRWGYNGWHDWCSSKTAGIPEGVKNLAHKYGALFILDEMRTGFRMSLGGAQEYYGVTPDLATFSKGMANGYAVSALVGRADVMDSLKESRFSSTFFTNTSEMAAAIKTIECIREKNVVPYIWKLGGKLMDGLREIIKVTGVEAEMIGVDIMPYIIFNYDNAKWISPTGFSGAPVFEPGGKVEKAWRTFYAEAAQGGVLRHPNHHWYVGMSHTEQDIDETLNVCETALWKVKEELQSPQRINRKTARPPEGARLGVPSGAFAKKKSPGPEKGRGKGIVGLAAGRLPGYEVRSHWISCACIVAWRRGKVCRNQYGVEKFSFAGRTLAKGTLIC